MPRAEVRWRVGLMCRARGRTTTVPSPPTPVRSPCQGNDPADAHPQGAQVSAGVGKPSHGLGVCI